METSLDRPPNGHQDLILRADLAQVDEPAPPIAKLERAARMLAEANTLDDIKSIRDTAETARIYAKTAKLGLELQNRAAEIKLRAERKAGKFLKSAKLQGGDRRSKLHDATLKLEDLGITKIQSCRWQLEASVSDEDFERFVELSHANDCEITAAALTRLAKHRRKRPSAGQTTSRRNGRDRSDIDNDDDDPSVVTAKREQIEELRGHQAALAEIITLLINTQTEAPTNNHRLAEYFLKEIARVIEEIAAGE